MLYHASAISGLRILKAKASTHGKPYVYAVDNKVTALIFGVRHDDFDFIISNNNNGKPIMFECYSNALEIIYKGKNCSIYELNNDGFHRGMTNWQSELVCGHDVTVHNEIHINDVYEELLHEETQGNIVINRYNDTSDYKKIISEHIVDRLIRFDAMGKLETDERFKKYYCNIIEALRSVMDGHLL